VAAAGLAQHAERRRLRCGISGIPELAGGNDRNALRGNIENAFRAINSGKFTSASAIGTAGRNCLLPVGRHRIHIIGRRGGKACSWVDFDQRLSGRSGMQANSEMPQLGAHFIFTLLRAMVEVQSLHDVIAGFCSLKLIRPL
jgi:hypothetical protein